MPEELSYVLITPYSIRKSRTGGIVSRLISRTGLNLIRARMFAPSRELIERYAESIITAPDPRHRKTQELIREYVLTHLLPNPAIDNGAQPHTMLLVFQGEDAVEKIRNVAGHIVHERTSGETIRDTYGDYVTDGDGKILYFEPAVLVPPDAASAVRSLKLWAEFAGRDGGLLSLPASGPEPVEKTLVLIKPDNFRFPNLRPGGVIDVFSRTGLSIIGMKVHHMSVAQASRFYGPVLEMLQKLMAERSGNLAKLAVERELGIVVDEKVQQQLAEVFGPICGRQHWESIVQFMAGTRPSECPPGRENEPGSEKCIALVYQGVDAVRKIRQVLGPTDPSKAPPGSIRREFGETIMVNAAHASDSAENAAREMAIIEMEENNLQPFVEAFYANA